MIPLRDENPTRTTPYVVYALILLNVLIFAVDKLGTKNIPIGVNPMGQTVTFPQDGLWNYSMVPKQVTTGNSATPVVLGSRVGQLVLPHNTSPFPAWFTIFTSMFLHGNLLHIAGNMWYLWIFGNNIEDALGHVKFILFYLAGGFIAAIAHIASGPMSQVPTVGASGAIAAVLGAYIILFPGSRIQSLVLMGFIYTTMAVPAVIVLGLWIAMQVLNASAMTAGSGGVAYWAHIGGFAAGIFGILLLGGKRLLDRQRSSNYPREWYGH